jgi:hypothetical protein
VGGDSEKEFGDGGWANRYQHLDVVGKVATRGVGPEVCPESGIHVANPVGEMVH